MSHNKPKPYTTGARTDMRGIDSARLSHSPRAIRENNSDPNNTGSGDVSLGMSSPRTSPENRHADEIASGGRYAPKFEPR